MGTTIPLSLGQLAIKAITKCELFYYSQTIEECIYLWYKTLVGICTRSYNRIDLNWTQNVKHNFWIVCQEKIFESNLFFFWIPFQYKKYIIFQRKKIKKLLDHLPSCLKLQLLNIFKYVMMMSCLPYYF